MLARHLPDEQRAVGLARHQFPRGHGARRRLIEYSAHYPTIMALLATLPFEKNATVFLSGAVHVCWRTPHLQPSAFSYTAGKNAYLSQVSIVGHYSLSTNH